ncbi:MAG TPA: hypothetical protein VEG33_22365, partial [Streptosporangiaceae bacterium]|nr:hypothetical protein [Streptosporangiaceae bacterium]
MSPRSRGGLDALLTADAVLGQIEAAVLVTDRLGNLRYANAYAAGLFGLPDDAGRLAGLPVLSLLGEEGAPGQAERDPGRAAGLVRQVLEDGAWDGTFTSVGPDG